MSKRRSLHGSFWVRGLTVPALAAAAIAGCEQTTPDVADPVGSVAEQDQRCGASGDLAPLSCVRAPSPTGGDIVNQAAAVRLGKALFWDVQAGGDGQVACATCHFHGGADM